MSRRRRLLVSVPILALLCTAVGAGTWSAFSSTTGNSGNNLTAGTVVIGDNDTGSALMTLSNAKPGDFTTRCITVTYSGSLAANVRIYAAVSGAMGSYVDLTVTRGTNSSAFPSCTNFTADSTNYIGAGNGVIYSGTLASFPTSAGAGNEPTSGSPATWNNGDPHSYKFTATFQSSAPAAAQGSTATADFTWEATNQ